MKQVSFEEIGSVAATFHVQAGVKAGQVVGLLSDGTVGACSAGERFCGVALSVASDGVAGVQVGGFATVAVSGALTAGWKELVADGNGGVKAAGAGETGILCLVAAVDTQGDTAVLRL